LLQVLRGVNWERAFVSDDRSEAEINLEQSVTNTETRTSTYHSRTVRAPKHRAPFPTELDLRLRGGVRALIPSLYVGEEVGDAECVGGGGIPVPLRVLPTYTWPGLRSSCLAVYLLDVGLISFYFTE
jgi:hypothetical protein